MAKRDDRNEIVLDNGLKVLAQEPVIISASRSTDIPAFYCDWFFHRLRIGYSAWTNPFNGVKMYVSYAKTRFVVFWSKNPKPLLLHLEELQERGINCYIHYTLNDYEKEGLEHSVPQLSERIETFKALVDRLGVGSVIWRFDPLILTEDINIDKLLRKIENIGDLLKGYTEKLVFSFVDIGLYKKVQANLKSASVSYVEWTKEQMAEFARKLVALNKAKGWNYQLATCGEAESFEGVEHNHCIDDVLIIQRAYKDRELMKYLHAEISSQVSFFKPDGAIDLPNNVYAIITKSNKDKGQREFCGCVKSKDIGQYNTCIHQCEYCYANTNKQIAIENYKKHIKNPYKDSIV